jgi:hypothetical protein
MVSTRSSFIAIIRRRERRAYWRVPISLIAALAIFIALFHGHCAVAGSEVTLQASAIGSLSKMLSAEVPDHQLPGNAHCDHCLCHAAAQGVPHFDSGPIEFGTIVHSIRADRSMSSLASAAPFKPPRV